VLVDGVTSMEAIVSGAIAPWRFSVWLFTLFAALAFVLAAVGLSSLVSLDVANRRHELAVRLALGAAQGQVTRTVFLAAARPIVAGVVVGVFAALAGTRAMRSLLFAVDSADTLTYAAVIALVLAVIGLAAYLPIRRAASIDPVALLRRV
jgi:putative ABC transport system permease protein